MRLLRKIWQFFFPPPDPPEPPKKLYPIIEIFGSRPCPERAMLNEELVRRAFVAEDGQARFFYEVPNGHCVELELNDVVVDLRHAIPREFHPLWREADAKVQEWFREHGYNGVIRWQINPDRERSRT